MLSIRFRENIGFCASVQVYWTGYTHILVDGEWNSWEPWEDCSVSCGGGISVRERICHQPLHGGSNCTGTNTETKECNTQECPGKRYNFFLVVHAFAKVTIKRIDSKGYICLHAGHKSNREEIPLVGHLTTSSN